ncbi:hypothetical protein DFR49_1854 [Hephaestia caeni]|uniref:Uncharacterized protein n=1 Tax=Hephaestia caeni TaxID=645617 RepID=A0A397P249_9SPHN|nr:hypothetical protein [Hephaestia caeni]RIA43630.1 hypothetical protein DFR49_1854 [Hephaestia caeni]
MRPTDLRTALRSPRGLTLIAVAGAGLVPASATPMLAQDVYERFGGSPYVGAAAIRVEIPGRKPDIKQGRGTARLVHMKPARADFRLEAKVSGARIDIETNVKGGYDRSGWRSDPGDILIRISAGGVITGGGTDAGSTFRYSGKVSPTHFTMTSEVRNGKAAHGLPAGAVIRIDYDLSRKAPVPSSKDGKGCHMATRPIGSAAGGPMTLGLVPVCD